MPKRTNEFQQLVLLLQKHLAERYGWRVEESRMIRDRVTGVLREVDIVVEGDVGGARFLVGIECQNTGRKSDLQWVQKLAAKHERLTNKLLLVSAAPFTSTAIGEARSRGIDTVSFSDAAKLDWSAYIDQLADLCFGLFDMTLQTYSVDWLSGDSTGDDPDSVIEPTITNGVGEPVLLSAAVKSMLRDRVLADQIMNRWYADSMSERKSAFNVEFTFTPNEPQQWVLIQPPDRRWRVRQVRGVIAVKTRETTLRMTSTDYLGSRLLHGAAPLTGGGQVRLVMTERQGELPTASIAIVSSAGARERVATMVVAPPQKSKRQ